MNIQEALNRNRCWRRKGRDKWWKPRTSLYRLNISCEDILADDYEVKEHITKIDLETAWDKTVRNRDSYPEKSPVAILAEELGL